MLNRSAIKDLVYGGLKELASNTEFYYQSPVSSEYSHLTDAGREAVADYLDRMLYIINKSEEESLNIRAKQMVINGLKGENN